MFVANHDGAFGIVAVAAETGFATWVESVFQQFRPSVCSVAASLCLGVCLLFTRLFTHFSAVHSLLLFVLGTSVSCLNSYSGIQISRTLSFSN